MIFPPVLVPETQVFGSRSGKTVPHLLQFTVVRVNVHGITKRYSDRSELRTRSLAMRKTILLMLGLCSVGSFAQRLPTDVVPSHYSLAFTPDLGAAVFAGRETLQVRVVQPTDRITLNAADIDFKKAVVRSGAGE